MFESLNQPGQFCMLSKHFLIAWQFPGICFIHKIWLMDTHRHFQPTWWEQISWYCIDFCGKIVHVWKAVGGTMYILWEECWLCWARVFCVFCVGWATDLRLTRVPLSPQVFAVHSESESPLSLTRHPPSEPSHPLVGSAQSALSSRHEEDLQCFLELCCLTMVPVSLGNSSASFLPETGVVPQLEF